MKKQFSFIAILFIQAINILQAQTDWHITGNAGTSPSTQFLGTTDNKALKIRTNNSVRLTISSTGEVGIGTSPAFKLDIKGGSINTDSVYRIGGETVLSVKGFLNTFVGINSGDSITTGGENTAIGRFALSKATTASYNSACGYRALFTNQTGYYNSAFGESALYNNVSGGSNVAIGGEALFHNINGYDNTASGTLALYSNSSGIKNTAAGTFALYSNI